jgi:hypothetical protein
MLALAFLVFAFAQPYIPVKENLIKSGKKAVSIYIDNSMSMENITVSGNMLENAKKIAGEIVKAYDINDEYQVITNDLSAKHQRFYEQDNVLSLINDVSISPYPKKISSVIARQLSMLDETGSKNRIIYVLSDMQKSSADIDRIADDSSAVKYFIPLNASSYNNIAIDSAWLDKPILRLNQQVNLKVNITNFSDKAVEDASVILKMNGLQKGLANYNLAPNQTITVSIPFTISQPGWNKLVLSITDYPFTFDDDYYMSFYIRDRINILCLNNDLKPNPFLRAVYSTDEYFSYTQDLISAFDKTELNKFQFLILNEANSINAGMISKLNNYVAEGGNLLIIPSSQIKQAPDLYNSLLSNFSIGGFDKIDVSELKMNNLNTENALMKDIFTRVPQNADLPKVKKYYSHPANVFSSEIPLLKLDNKQSLLSYVPYLRGNVFVLSVPLNDDWSNFPRHAIFLPVMYQLALQYVNSIPLSFELMPNKNIILSDVNTNSKVVYSLKSEGRSFIPDQKTINGQLNLFTNEDFNKAGFYTLTYNSGEEAANPVLAFNYKRSESNTSCYSSAELKKLSDEKAFSLIKSKYNNSKLIIDKIKSGRPLWKLCLIFTLMFLISEIILIRFWKI